MCWIPCEKKSYLKNYFMKKALRKKIGSAKEMFGIEIKVNPELDKYSDVVLFPEKLAYANKMLAKLKCMPLV